MPDNLDNDALAYMQERNPSFSQSRQLSFEPNPFGGKARTRAPTRERQRRSGGTYISDEPERFERHISDFKDQFITPEQAKQLIMEKWASDSSLANLLDGIERVYGGAALERELNALIGIPSVNKQFSYIKIAKRLRIAPKKFRRTILPFISEDRLSREAERVSRERAYRPQLQDLLLTTRQGTIRGQNVSGTATIVKIKSKQVVRYRAPNGQFIKAR